VVPPYSSLMIVNTTLEKLKAFIDWVKEDNGVT
jgi:hypothetical protein